VVNDFMRSREALMSLETKLGIKQKFADEAIG